jgi:hypothetical protein
MPSAYLTDLIDHKRRVALYLSCVANELFRRAAAHDNSKFAPEEYDAYEAALPGLQQHAYGTLEYRAELARIQPAIAHHYAANDHHPEHFPGGVGEMNLMQLIEMVCDWIAASERSRMSLFDGLDKSKERFGIDEQLFAIIRNTVLALTFERR